MSFFDDYGDEMPEEFAAFAAGVRAAATRMPEPSRALADLLITGVSSPEPKRSFLMKAKTYVAGLGLATKIVLCAGVAAAATTTAAAAGVVPNPIEHVLKHDDPPAADHVSAEPPHATTTTAAPARHHEDEHPVVTVEPTTTTTAVPTALPQVRVTGLGDSVLLEAKAELERRLPDASIDAEVGRQFKELLALAKAQRDSGRLGQIVILQLGNNGPVTASQFDDLMEVLRNVPRVVVINVKVPRPWEGPNNDMLADGVRRWPNTVLVDWHKQGAANPQYFGDDGIHMGPKGISVFTDMILAAV